MKPSDYPPPWRVEEALASPSDADPVEVDVAIVGAGPAGLAAAIRLGQAAPELSVAVLEKGKRPGSHLLSGAVVRPGPLRQLAGEDFPSYGEVPAEAVYFLTRSRAWRNSLSTSTSRFALAIDSKGISILPLVRSSKTT